MLLQYFLKKENKYKLIADEIYKNIIKISKNIHINYNFLKFQNYKSSFEIITIFMIFYMNMNKNLKKSNYKKINQFLINNFIDDLDRSLRSNGIGDMSIGKYVKNYVKKFYFRVSKLDPIINLINEKNLVKYFNYFDFVKESKLEYAANKIINIFEDLKI